MSLTTTLPPPPTGEIVERTEHGLVILAPAQGRPHRRVLFVNSYGGASLWKKIKNGEMPPHHLWGCLELVRRGYEVALAEPLPDFYLYRRPLPHDLKLLKMARAWLGRDGIVYCGHNVLYWIPFLKQLGLVRARIVSLLFAREPLDMSLAHSGIIALNPAAAEQARKLAPQAKVAHLGWGVDLNSYPKLPYQPKSFISVGVTWRDHPTLAAGAARGNWPIRVICPASPPGVSWSKNVEVTTGGQWLEADKKSVSYHEILHSYYAQAAASLIITRNDPAQYGAVGFTNLIEAMAMARPVIITRSGATTSEIDIERAGCGLYVPPEDPAALAQAFDAILNDPARAEAMGQAGRRLCETHYNIGRYGAGLHQFFETL